MRSNRWSLTALLGALTLSACAHGNIPGTEIEDNDANRGILKLVEEYKQAVERMDVAAVMALVSPRFYEDNGNVDTADDYDYKGLEANLRTNFEHTKAIQLMLRVDDVKVDTDEAYAELYYQIRAHADYPSGPKWETGSDRTRLRFEKVDDRWLIVAGL